METKKNFKQSGEGLAAFPGMEASSTELREESLFEKMQAEEARYKNLRILLNPKVFSSIALPLAVAASANSTGPPHTTGLPHPTRRQSIHHC